MSASFQYPNKAFLTQILSVAEMKAGIIKHQPADAGWVEKNRTKAQMSAKASLTTLILTMIDKLQKSEYEEKNIALLVQFLANKQRNEPHSIAATSSNATKPTRLLSKSLQTHLAVLKAAGLLSKEEEDNIDSFLTLCKHERDTIDGKDGILDIITQELIENDDDIVRLSDGHCYSKNSIIDFIRSGAVDTGTGRPYLPIAKKAIEKADYDVLGIREPTKAEEDKAIEAQEMDNLLQLRFGDIEAWRAGRGPAREEFAPFLTNLVERAKLAKAFGVRTTELEPVTHPLPIQPKTQAKNAERESLKIRKQIISAGSDFDTVPVRAIMQSGQIFERVAFDGEFETNIEDAPKEVSVCAVDGYEVLFNNGQSEMQRFFNEKWIGGRKIVSIVSKGFVNALLLEDGKVLIHIEGGDSDAFIGDNLVAGRSKYIAAGREFVIGIFDDGSLWALGEDKYLALPENINNKKYISVDGGDEFAVAITEEGEIKVWTAYDDVKGTIGHRLANGRKFIAVSAGKDFIVGLLDDNSVIVWGNDEYGVVSKAENAIKGRKIVAIDAGWIHVVALTENRELVVWGYDAKYKDDDDSLKIQDVRCMLPTDNFC